MCEKVGYNLRNTHFARTHGFCKRMFGSIFGILTLPVPMSSLRLSEYTLRLYLWFLWEKSGHNCLNTHFACTHGFCERRLDTTVWILTLSLPIVSVRESWYIFLNTHYTCTHGFCERKLGTTFGILTLLVHIVSVRERRVQLSEYSLCLYSWFLWEKVRYFWWYSWSHDTHSLTKQSVSYALDIHSVTEKWKPITHELRSMTERPWSILTFSTLLAN